MTTTHLLAKFGWPHAVTWSVFFASCAAAVWAFFWSLK